MKRKWKKKVKRKWKQKQKRTGQQKKDGKKKKEKLEHCWTQHIGKKKRTDIFSKIDSTSQHRLKKKKKRKLNIFELWL